MDTSIADYPYCIADLDCAVPNRYPPQALSNNMDDDENVFIAMVHEKLSGKQNPARLDQYKELVTITSMTTGDPNGDIKRQQDGAEAPADALQNRSSIIRSHEMTPDMEEVREHWKTYFASSRGYEQR